MKRKLARGAKPREKKPAEKPPLSEIRKLGLCPEDFAHAGVEVPGLSGCPALAPLTLVRRSPERWELMSDAHWEHVAWLPEEDVQLVWDKVPVEPEGG